MSKIDLQEGLPSGVKLEATFLIDQKMWMELKSEGWSDKDLADAIKKSITFKGTVGGALGKVPLSDVFEVDLVKYY